MTILQKGDRAKTLQTSWRLPEAYKNCCQNELWLIDLHQHAHPPDCGCDWDELLEDLRLTSTMSSCFVEESVSIPGKAAAILRKSAWKGQINSTGLHSNEFLHKQELKQHNLKMQTAPINPKTLFSCDERSGSKTIQQQISCSKNFADWQGN